MVDSLSRYQRWAKSLTAGYVSMVGVLGLVLVGTAASTTPQAAPTSDEPTQIEKVIAFCSKTVNQDAPLCSGKTSTPEQVEDAVDDYLTDATPAETTHIVDGGSKTVRRVNKTTTTQQQPVPTPSPTSEPVVEVPDLPQVETPKIVDVPLNLLNTTIAGRNG